MIRQGIIILLSLMTIVSMTTWIISHYDVAGYQLVYIELKHKDGYRYSRCLIPGVLRIRYECNLSKANYNNLRKSYNFFNFHLNLNERQHDTTNLERRTNRTSSYYSRYYSIDLPFWMTTILFALYPLYYLTFHTLRNKLQAHRGFCIQCSYNLTGNESGVCPECGTEILT